MWDMGNLKSDTDIAKTTWSRAKKRLTRVQPINTGNNSWLLPGLEEFDDYYEEYELSTDGEGLWYCTCYDHYGGAFRQEKVCSHSAAVALHTGLPCQGTRPLKEKPKERVPARPCDIPGIPEKYQSWRPYQKECIERGLRELDNGVSFLVWDAPTGSGKSLNAVCVSKLLGLKTVYCVSTIQLQQQLAADFPDVVVIWGRDHYNCIRFTNTELTAADCTHHKQSPCPKYSECPYKRQKKAALAADLAVVNYPFFLVEANNVGGFSGWPLAVFDEGDTCEGELMKYVSMTITANQLEKCEIEPPKRRTVLDAWLEWAPPTRAKVNAQLKALELELEPYLEAEVEPPVQLMREILRYQRLLSKLTGFTSWLDDSWVLDMTEDRWEFKPTLVRRQGKLLWGHAQRILVMSATILSAKDWAWNLGLIGDTK